MGHPAVTIVLAVVAAISLFLSFIGFLYITRGNPIERIRVIKRVEEPPAVSDPAFRRQFERYTNTRLSHHNNVEVLFNGEQVYPRLWEDLETAESLITWHVFWFKPGELADRLHEILCRKAREGIQVLFLYDRFGAMGVDKEYFHTLKEAGAEVNCFRPLDGTRCTSGSSDRTPVV